MSIKSIFLKLKKSKANTLVEVLVAIVIISMVLVNFMKFVTFSYINLRNSYIRTNAVYYAQDLIEYFRRERAVLGWTNFKNIIDNNISIGDKQAFCVNGKLPDPGEFNDFFSDVSLGECANFSPLPGEDAKLGLFKRELTIKNLSDEKIKLVVEVSWINLTNDNQVSPRYSVNYQVELYKW